MKRLGLIVLSGLAWGNLLNAKVSVGDRAPEVHLNKLLPEQPVANASLEALAGKAVVLEVWATWCGPCVGAIPQLNELAGKFKDKPKTSARSTPRTRHFFKVRTGFCTGRHVVSVPTAGAHNTVWCSPLMETSME